MDEGVAGAHGAGRQQRGDEQEPREIRARTRPDKAYCGQHRCGERVVDQVQVSTILNPLTDRLCLLFFRLQICDSVPSI